MRIIIIMVTFCFSLSVFAKGDPYSRERDKKALKFAYEVIKLYYPANDICASDSIKDLDYWAGFSFAVDKETIKMLYSHRFEKSCKYDKPIYSKTVARLFEQSNNECNNIKHVIDFSEPYKKMILCAILPIDRKIGINGCPRITVFLFRYDEEGNIYQISNLISHID